MPASRTRLPIGQLLVLVLAAFRTDLYNRSQVSGFQRIRPAHLQVFGNIDWKGTRLTALAERAGITRPSMAELVDELERAGYIDRRLDPADRRAKLILLTREGRRVVTRALRAVRDIEHDYAEVVGEKRFDELCRTLQDLVDHLPTARAKR